MQLKKEPFMRRVALIASVATIVILFPLVGYTEGPTLTNDCSAGPCTLALPVSSLGASKNNLIIPTAIYETPAACQTALARGIKLVEYSDTETSTTRFLNGIGACMKLSDFNYTVSGGGNK